MFIYNCLSNFRSVLYFNIILNQNLLIVACILLFIYKLILWYNQNQFLPPGPSGWPIIGVLNQIKKDFHLYLYDNAKIYGNIFSIKMGSQTFIILSDQKIIKQAFSTRQFNARPKTEFLQTIFEGYGIINAEGDLWKSNRRFLIRNKLGLRHWGQGMNQVESRINTEILNILSIILENYTNPTKSFNPAKLISCCFSNIICSILMSVRFHHEDKKFQRFMFLNDDGFRLFSKTIALIFFPILRYIPGIKSACHQLIERHQEMLLFVREIVEEHRKNLDPENAKDLIDAYLLEMEKKDILFGSNPSLQLQQILIDLFSAGIETLKKSLLWSILFMIRYPSVMTKVQRELDKKIGDNRLPCIKDIKELPYVRATLYEVLRRSSVVPLGITHSTNSEVKFCGYTIPRNAHVIPLLHAVHMDPKIWENPEEFNPERFLDSATGEVKKPGSFIPFGVGQRMCLGDQLAEIQLFLLFSSILYLFDLKNPEGMELPSLNGIAEVAIGPKDFEIICVPRTNKVLISQKMN